MNKNFIGLVGNIEDGFSVACLANDRYLAHGLALGMQRDKNTADSPAWVLTAELRNPTAWVRECIDKGADEVDGIGFAKDGSYSVVLLGDVIDGCTFIGPFASLGAGNAFGEDTGGSYTLFTVEKEPR